MPDGAVAYVHAGQLSGQAPEPRAPPRAPGVYLTADVSVGEHILPDHLEAVGTDRIPSGEIGGYAIMAGGCYADAKAAGSRLRWSDVSVHCRR